MKSREEANESSVFCWIIGVGFDVTSTTDYFKGGRHSI